MGFDYLAWCREREPTALELLQELVAIDSGPDHPPGWVQVTRIAERELTALGLKASIEQAGPGSPVLTAENASPGTGPRLLLLAHLDTVFKAGTAANRPFTIEGDRAMGPGVADMKGGFVGMILALQCLAHEGWLDFPLTVLTNCDEEIGSMHSRPMIERVARGADFALVFEPARPDGSLVTKRRGHRRFRLEVSGRAAHTGVNPQDGANAIVTAARWVVALEEARSSFPEGTTVTAALIEGGSSINTVPDRAVVSIDVRVPDETTADRIEDIIRGLTVAAEPGTSTELVRFVARPPMVEVEGVETLTRAIQGAAYEVGVPATFTTTGGSSDAGITSSVGVPSVDGLGPVGGGYHTSDEFLTVSTIAKRSALAAAAIRRLTTN